MPKKEKRNKLLGRLNSDHREAKASTILKKKKEFICLPLIALFICERRIYISTRLLGSEKRLPI